MSGQFDDRGLWLLVPGLRLEPAPGTRDQRPETLRLQSRTLLSVLFQSPVQRAAREPQRASRLAHVAAVAVHRLLHEKALDLLERELLEPRRLGRAPQRQVADAEAVARRHQHRALDGVVELAHVAGPGV